MTKGSIVKIFPHGHEEQTEVANVLLLSPNERSIALQFEEPPIFCKRLLDEGGKIGIDRSTAKVTMLLGRESVGPWVELTGGGQYEIEETH